MKTLLFTLFSVFLFTCPPAQGLGDPGPYAVGYRDLSFNDATLASPDVDVRVYYPATSAGANTALASGGTFPRLAFGHGFNLNYLDYELICGHLASYGYVVITPDVQNGFNVDHQEYARELGACLRYLETEGNDMGSDFYQRIDTMSGVLGHSMGGGASGLVPSVYPEIDAVSGLASAETSPSAIAALASYSGPYQVISGSEDNTAPETGNQADMYSAVTGPRQWVSLTGGGHCKFTDGSTICDLVSSPGSISRTTQIHRSNKYLVAFFNYHLKGDPSAQTYICGDSVLADEAAARVSNTTNISCSTVSLDEPMSNFSVYPNPFLQSIAIEGEGQFEVWDAFGRQIWEGEVHGKTVLSTADWSSGIYWLTDGTGRGSALVKE